MFLQELALTESINDKGRLKAVFFAGVPGAGKSYVGKKITDGSIAPRIVNTDNYIEFVGRMKGADIGDKDVQHTYLDNAKQITKRQLKQYINGMLPMFIDGTSSNAPNTLRRMGILEGFGYDVYMVWVDTPIETAVARASKRERAVDEDFIRSVYRKSMENKAFYQSKMGGKFLTVNNGDGELDNKAVIAAYRKASKFFHSGLENPIGKRILQEMEQKGDKYLMPEYYSEEEIDRLLAVWYKR